MSELMIAGIPATEWVGRRIHFRGHPNKQHGTPGLIMKLAKKKVGIKPLNHKKIEWFLPEAIFPRWSINDDLREKYGIHATIPEMVTENLDEEPDYPEELVEADMAAIDEIEVAPLPDAASERAEEILQRKKPRMVIHDHTSLWMPTYNEYQASLNAEATDLAMLEELQLALAEHTKTQRTLEARLASLGVEIVYDEVERPTEVARRDGHAPRRVHTQTASNEAAGLYPFAAPPGNKKHSVVDKVVGQWFGHMKKRLKEGEEISGTIGGWATKLNVSWKTLETRLDRARGLRFVDEKGNEGSKARGFIRILLE